MLDGLEVGEPVPVPVLEMVLLEGPWVEVELALVVVGAAVEDSTVEVALVLDALVLELLVEETLLELEPEPVPDPEPPLHPPVDWMLSKLPELSP